MVTSVFPDPFMDLDSWVQSTGLNLDDIDLNMDDVVEMSYAAVMANNIKTENP